MTLRQRKDELTKECEALNALYTSAKEEAMIAEDKLTEAQVNLAVFTAQSEERQTHINESVDALLAKRKEEYVRDLREFQGELLNGAITQMAADLDGIDQKKADAIIELTQIQAELEDFQKKQKAANEEILRRRAIEENQDFYRLNLSDEAMGDIKVLREVRHLLRNQANFDKMIYDTYISKSATELVKRVLAGEAPCGIYKITRMKTGEIYIGKSTDVKSRWIQHLKTAYGCGTIAHSILHTTMERDGVENFTFELIEEVPKDQLTEREKFWITFYGSKEYGLNERLG